MGGGSSKEDEVKETKDKDGKDGEKHEEGKKVVNKLKELEDKRHGAVIDLTPHQALQHAADHGDLDGIRQHIKNNADVNMPDNGPVIPPGKSAEDPIYKNAIVTGDYPLHKAAQNGHVEAVEVLYLMMAPVENRDRLGSTALHRAVSHNQLAVVRKLLSPGIDADVTARNNIGNTPLHIAAYCGYMDMTKILLDHGAYRLKSSPNRVGMTPLDLARKPAMVDLINNYMPGMSSSEVKQPASSHSSHSSTYSAHSQSQSTPASALLMSAAAGPYAAISNEMRPLVFGGHGHGLSLHDEGPVTIRLWEH